MIIPTLDRTLPTVIACLDETLHRFGGAPTYALTDNDSERSRSTGWPAANPEPAWRPWPD